MTTFALAVLLLAQASGWEAEAKALGFTERDVETLRKQKVLITGETYKECFVPYVGRDGARKVRQFITSDALLNAFHRLNEASMLCLERANARKLSSRLRAIAEDLAKEKAEGDADLLTEARSRADFVLAVARRLSGDEVGADDKAVLDEVDEVLRARRIMTPAWLGVEIDYRRFRPVAFYARDEKLSAYFRAIRWLQAVPFRVEEDVDLAAFALFARGWRIRDVVISFDAFLGIRDNLDLRRAAEIGGWNADRLDRESLAAIRKTIVEEIRKLGPGINDRPDLVKPHPDLRLISSYRLPDAVMIQRTMELELTDRPFPSGLELAAALGSKFAMGHVRDDKALRDLLKVGRGGGVYDLYLDCIESLLDAPEQDAPAFMSSDAWAAKSVQAALSSWAQMQNTMSLHREMVNVFGRIGVEPGYVEPDPEFFARLRRLASAAGGALAEAGAFEPDYAAAATRIREVIRLREMAKPDEKDVDRLDEAAQILYYSPNVPLDDLKAGLIDVEKSRKPANSLLNGLMNGWRQDLGSRWSDLAEVALRLETLAHKQLRGAAFSKDDASFIESVGETLARIMQYWNTHYQDDDAPRVADVFSNTTAGRLQAAIGRARAIYVLYPTKDGDVLCRGSVMPYYEFTRGQPLTDAEWKALLDSDKRPAEPAWTADIRSETRTDPPARK